MNFGEFRKVCLEHLDQYQIAGEIIDSTYNNQDDYKSRIVALANDAFNTIARTTRPIMASIHPATDDEFRENNCTDLQNGWTRVRFPDDFWKLTGRGLPIFYPHGRFERSENYQHISDNEIIVRTRELPHMELTYYRLPRRIHGNPDEVIDATDDVCYCAAFYVAAHLAMGDDAFAYQALYNEYEAKRELLRRPIETEKIETHDVYGTPYLNWIGV